ncbi:MAG: endonuclease/exonuclease/phosphatase family protein [Phycisphaerae bacterium]|nr:endonuclease/exonuclease/phosphatase family protein [Phycisphaerae bacterium]
MIPWSLVGLLVWSDRPYALDLLSHFLLHAAGMLFVIALALLALRRWRSGANLVLVALILTTGWRLAATAPTGGLAHPGTTIRLVEFNMHGERARHDNEAITWLRDQDPDLVVLIEPPFGLLNDYPFLREKYPYTVEPAAGLMWEVMLLSRFPAEVQPIAEYSEETKFSFAARRSLIVRPPNASPFLLSAMHPPSPRTAETWRKSLEGAELNAGLFRAWRDKTSMPIVVAGDFNSTPVGRVHQTFARISGLKRSSPLLGGGTWPSRVPAAFALPIDCVWTSSEWTVNTIQVGPRFRSDHRPIVAELELPPPPKQPPSESTPREPLGGSVR